jgi:hypothetical protein
MIFIELITLKRLNKFEWLSFKKEEAILKKLIVISLIFIKNIDIYS